MATKDKEKDKDKAPKAGAVADDEPAEGESKPASKFPKFKLPAFGPRTLIIAATVLLLLGGAGVGAYFFFSATAESKPAAMAAPKPATFLDLPDVMVNLANTGSERTQYLKVKIVLELPDQAMVAQVQPMLPRVLDAFQTYLRELRATDLDGSAGLYRLKEELTRRVNAAIAPGRINAVLFKEIVVQ